MKACCGFVLLCLFLPISFGQAKDQDQSITPTVEEFEQYVYAFCVGLGVKGLANATVDCIESVDLFLIDIYDSYEDYEAGNYYDFILATADSLGETSPLARNCTESTEDIFKDVHSYVKQFSSFKEWISHVANTFWDNLDGLDDIALEIYWELNNDNPNYTHVWEAAGEFVYWSINANTTKALDFTESDPLEPALLNEYVWITVESIYEFFTKSTLADESLGKCEVAFVNMILFQSDSYHNFAARHTEEAIFLTLDSFVFLHDIIESCYEAGQQIHANGTAALEFISTSPVKIIENFFHHFFHVNSCSAGIHAQIYYKDVISFFKLAGEVAANTLIEQKE